MPIQPRTYLKSRFENGDIPDQNDFGDVIDSYIHESEDGLTIYSAPDSTLRLGINTTTPGGPLGIKENPTGKFITFHQPDNTPVWDIDRQVNPVHSGLSLSERTISGNVSRLFVEETTGYVGIGTIAPNHILEINDTKPDSVAGLKILNISASAVQPGWTVGHTSNASVTEKDGAFSIMEEPVPGASAIERLTILPGGHVGVNQILPDTFFHVSRVAIDPDMPVDLREHTGIAEFGLILGKNIVFDDQGMQARVGSDLGGGVTLLEVSDLHLQELGGKLLIHGKSSTPATQKVIVDANGNTGIGMITPAEKLEVNGRIVVGDSVVTPVAGAIRWSGTDFEGFNGTTWVSLTDNGGATSFWTLAATDAITYNATNAKIGVGISVPTSALDVRDNTAVSSSSTSAKIFNTSATSIPDADNHRIGMELQCTGTFTSEAQAKNIALLVSAVTGQAANANMAAVLNDNVVIGEVTTGSDMVGTSGNRVLVMQKGTAPATAVPGSGGLASNAIQIYSDAVSSMDPTCVFNVMNSDGHVVKLYKQSPMPDRDEHTVSDTYTSVEQNVIINLRDRIDALEAILVNLGFFDSSSVLP